MFVSIGVRFRANVEALNMAESVGNVTRHRRVPAIVKTQEGLKLLYVPAISGESLAHAVQANLVEVAKALYKNSPPLDLWSLRGEFIKFADNKHLTPSLQKVVKSQLSTEEKQHMFEKTAIAESIVADVGGFLYAENPPVRRTSPLQVGYAIPVEDAINLTAIESQVHARQVPVGITAEEERRAQMLYYVEIASAIYGVTINLDTDAVGVTSMVKVEPAVSEDERRRRVKATIGALALTLGQAMFGAKRSRFNPVLEVVDAVVALSSPLQFTVSPPQKSGYIKDTLARAEAYKEFMAKLGIPVRVDVATYGYPEHSINVGSVEQLFTWILEKLGV